MRKKQISEEIRKRVMNGETVDGKTYRYKMVNITHNGEQWEEIRRIPLKYPKASIDGWETAEIIKDRKSKNALEWHRLSMQMTQKQLAEASGLNVRLIQKAENGDIKLKNMTAKNLLAIADALGVDIHLLLEEYEDETWRND